MCISVYALYLDSLIFKKDHHVVELSDPQKADFNNCEVLLNVALNLSPPLLNIQSSCWQQTLKC